MLRMLLLALFLAVVSPAHAQKIYKWTDSEGRVQYTQTPPPDGQVAERQDRQVPGLSEERREYCRLIERIAVNILRMRHSRVPQTAVSDAARRIEGGVNVEVDQVALRELVNYVYAAGEGDVSGRAHEACLGGSFGRAGLGARSTVRQGADPETTVDSERPGTSRARRGSAFSEPVSGTGWVTSGLIATNFHVVSNRQRIRVRLSDGREQLARIVAQDPVNDVALLKAEGRLPIGLPLASGEAGLGATVFTLGYPHTGIMGTNIKLSTGIISSQTGLRDDPRTYQISVPVQAGNSGGPLINARGEVVGLVTSKLSAAQVFHWTGDLPQNVNYAVKVGYLSQLLKGQPTGTSNLPASEEDLEAQVARATPAVVLVIAD